MKKYAIIVAGGKGIRMSTELPKQFIPINDKPLLMITLEAFCRYDNELELIVVLPVAQQEYWRTLCKQYGFSVSHRIANGGETRFHSVKNGLMLIPDTEESLVAIHDGVRPFVSQKTISEAFKCAEKQGTAVPAINPVDSVRQLTGAVGAGLVPALAPNSAVGTGLVPALAPQSAALDRTTLKMVQTPQVFKSFLLKEAYLQEYTPSFTDDASVVEKCGHPIILTEGNRENIKITTPLDLQIAEAIANNNEQYEF